MLAGVSRLAIAGETASSGSDYAHGGFRYHCYPSRYPHTRS